MDIVPARLGFPDLLARDSQLVVDHHFHAETYAVAVPRLVRDPFGFGRFQVIQVVVTALVLLAVGFALLIVIVFILVTALLTSQDLHLLVAVGIFVSFGNR